MKQLTSDGIKYSKETVDVLRCDLISLRDDFLGKNSFDASKAILLSHIIKLLSHYIDNLEEEK